MPGVDSAQAADSRQMLFLFTAASFLGATLTFLLEPFVAKMILPLFGGTPSVWNTCVLFFQGCLLASYAYAQLLTSLRHLRGAMLAHLALLILPLALLPVSIGEDWAPAPGTVPVLWQLLMLATTVGLPFFALAATAPLLQRWLSLSSHSSASDPYFLYAASNFGSLIALLAYPVLLEPRFDLTAISELWSVAYAALVLLIAACALALLRDRPVAPAAHHHHAPPSRALRLRWFTLAFIPSSMMLTVTTYLSTDVAAVPLLWVIPLLVYLASYIHAFARRRLVPTRVLERLLPIVLVLLAITLLAEGLELPAWALFPLHLGGLALVALACHGQLADLRPNVLSLTSFYSWIAAGGLAGGVFNVLVAPYAFNSLAEYPIILVLAALMRQHVGMSATGDSHRLRGILAKDLGPALLLGLCSYGVIKAAPALGLGSGRESVGLGIGVPAFICYLFLGRPVRFGLGLGALFLAGAVGLHATSDTVFAARTYYGTHEVRREGNLLELFHGKTLHGIERSAPETTPEPLAYYHKAGPVGALFRVLDTPGRTGSEAGLQRIGVIGLGVGSLAAYSRPGQYWTFYEIDPTVIFLARDSGLFRFLRHARGEVRIAQGDARLGLAAETGAQFDLLVLDAFSSDAVPAHLLTREALALYRQRLAPGGVLAFHISNRFLNLEEVVGALARDAGLQALSWADLDLPAARREAGQLPSQWIVISENTALLRRLGATGGWIRLARTSGPVWTDKFSNLVGVFRWTP